MRWFPFLIVAGVMIGLELGLKSGFALAGRPIAPSFVMVLAVVVAIGAPPKQALWACLLLGLTMDLTFDQPLGDGRSIVNVPGPYALGYLVAAQLTLAMRTLVFRKNPLTIALVSIFASLVANIVVVAFFTLRSMYDPVIWSASTELGYRFLSALYTGLLGLILSPLFLLLNPLMGLTTGLHRKGIRRL